MKTIINFSLKDLKDKQFEELVELYQNIDNGLLIKFRNFEKQYSRLKINKKISDAKAYNEAFLIISEAFFHHYNLFWKQYKQNPSPSSKIKMDDARFFFESCNIHVSKINIHYLQPLTIQKANRSIIFGILSVFIGIIATLLSCWFSYNSNIDLNHIESIIKNQENINIKIQKNLNYIDSLTRDNNNILKIITSASDSLIILNQ